MQNVQAPKRRFPNFMRQTRVNLEPVTLVMHLGLLTSCLEILGRMEYEGTKFCLFKDCLELGFAGSLELISQAG